MSRATQGEREKARERTVNTTVSVPVLAESGPNISDFTLQVCVSGTPASCLVDTGAVVSLISKDLWDSLRNTNQLLPLQGVKHKLVGVQGVPLKLYGAASVDITFGGVEKLYPADVLVADSLTTDVILGRDFLQGNRCDIRLGPLNQLHFTRERTTVNLGPGQEGGSIASVEITTDITLEIPPQSEMEIMARFPTLTTTGNSTWLVEPRSSQRQAVMVARAMVDPGPGKVPVRILNPRAEPVTIQKGTVIAIMEPLSDKEPVFVTSVDERREISGDKREQLWQAVCDVGDILSDEEQKQLYSVLLEYADLFAGKPDDFGRTDKIKHAINTGDAAPVRQQVRRIPPVRREEARRLLSEMLKKDVIKPSSSPWASPIVLVQKKDGSVRFCVDYRKVNALTRKDAYPLPRVDDTLDTLSGSKWFSTLDLISGYWQVEMDDKDREKTAFCTPDGLFEFKVMPFGLCNAPATFQRLMDMVLAGLQWTNCLVYLDDVIVVGRTFKEHLRNLRAVFGRLRAAGLKLQPKKCHLCSPKVEFLGHIVSADGVSTDPQKLDKVANWPVPTSK